MKGEETDRRQEPLKETARERTRRPLKEVAGEDAESASLLLFESWQTETICALKEESAKRRGKNCR